MTGRFVRAAATALAAVLALAACTTIPTTGPVNEGDGVVATADPFVPFAEGPRPGDGPTAIVSRFLTASSAGFASDFSVAREYLTPATAAAWDPTAQVIVFASGALTPEFNEAAGKVTYDVPVLATLDASGRMVEAADGTRQSLEFTVRQNSAGEWRISGLADGTILAAATFDRLFRPVSLIFSSVDQTTQVPEERWLPANKAATLAARELVEGPSPWLANAVVTGFPPTSALEVDSVVVSSGIAAVQLTPDSAGTPTQRALAQEQMRLTLTALPGITNVTLTAGGLSIGGDGSASLAREPLPGPDAAVFIDGRLGMWDGTDLWTVGKDVGGLPAHSTGLARGYSTARAAWIVGGDALVYSDAIAGGPTTLVARNADASAPSRTMDVSTLYRGTALVSPSIDRHGWIWTAQSQGPSEFVAANPGRNPVTLPVPWLVGSTVQALAVSRDGARIAVLSRTGGKQVLEVAEVVRGADGVPLTIGDPVQVGADIGPSIDAAWVDNLTVAVLGAAGGGVPSPLWLVAVGGLTTPQTSVTGATSLTARNGERSLIVVDKAGALFTRSGTVWSQVGAGPADLAYAG